MEFNRIADIKRVSFITTSVKRAIPPAGEILDIGCGNGLISKALGGLGYNVTGIDRSEKTIAAAIADNVLAKVHFKVVAAGELNPEPNRYDAIICSEVLEHLERPGDLLNVIHASLKDAGILIVTVPNGSGPRELLVTRPIQYLQKNSQAAWNLVSKVKSMLGYKGVTVQSSADDLTHLQFFTSASLKNLAEGNGFIIDKIVASNFIEQVFPFSLLTKQVTMLQRFDCSMADRLPLSFTSGFMSVWKKI